MSRVAALLYVYRRGSPTKGDGREREAHEVQPLSAECRNSYCARWYILQPVFQQTQGSGSTAAELHTYHAAVAELITDQATQSDQAFCGNQPPVLCTPSPNLHQLAPSDDAMPLVARHADRAQGGRPALGEGKLRHHPRFQSSRNRHGENSRLLARLVRTSPRELNVAG